MNFRMPVGRGLRDRQARIAAIRDAARAALVERVFLEHFDATDQVGGDPHEFGISSQERASRLRAQCMRDEALASGGVRRDVSAEISHGLGFTVDLLDAERDCESPDEVEPLWVRAARARGLIVELGSDDDRRARPKFKLPSVTDIEAAQLAAVERKRAKRRANYARSVAQKEKRPELATPGAELTNTKELDNESCNPEPNDTQAACI